MDLTALLPHVLKSLKPNTVFNIVNKARPSSDYLYTQWLPERNDVSFHISDADFVVRSTMAGIIAMDSPLPKGGAISMTTFMEKIAKFGIEFDLTEAQQRKLYEVAMHMMVRGQNPVASMRENVLNMTNLLLAQPLMDTMEYLRGQALFTGKLNWTFNDLPLEVDYKVPPANFLPRRTGTNAWTGTTSKFWEDIGLLRRKLKLKVQAYVCHPETLDAIVYNPANKIEITGEGENYFDVTRIVVAGTSGEKLSTNRFERARIYAYDLEGEVLDTANKGKTKTLTFAPREKLAAIGAPTANRTGVNFSANVGLGGASEDPQTGKELGYTHIGPTVEGGMRVGRWARTYIPEAKPASLVGQSVMNGLPYLRNASLIAVAESELVV